MCQCHHSSPFAFSLPDTKPLTQKLPYHCGEPLLGSPFWLDLQGLITHETISCKQVLAPFQTYRVAFLSWRQTSLSNKQLSHAARQLPSLQQFTF